MKNLLLGSQFKRWGAVAHGTAGRAGARAGLWPLGLLLALLLPAAQVAFGQTNATVTTDKTDYAPGSTVQITGSGFQPGETVQCQVLRIDIDENSGPEHVPWLVTNNDSGAFQTTWYVTADEVGAILQLTALGVESARTASVIFTDDSSSTMSGKVLLNSGTGAGVAGATIKAYSDAGLTTQDPTSGSSATSASDGSWTINISKGTTRYVVVTPPSGYHSLSATPGSSPTPTVVSSSEFSITTSTSGDNSANNLFILAGAATRLVITGSGTLNAGSSQNLTITAKDGSGNTDNTYNGSKTLTFSGANSSPNPATAPTVKSSSGTAVAFGSPTTITFSSGVATVTSGNNGVMTLYKAETATIGATDGSITSSGSDRLTVAVSPATASKLAFTTQPGNGTGGSALSTQPAVTLEDSYGNTVTSTSQNATLAIQYNAGSGTLSGSKTVAVNTSTGVATFSGLSIDKVGTGYTLTATGSTVNTTAGAVVSSGFNVTLGAPNAYRLAASTTSPTPRVADLLTVTLVDAGGNTVTTFTGDKNLTFSGLSTAGDGTHPTVSSKTGSAVNLGTAEAVSFTNGVSSAGGSLVAYKGETQTLNVLDDTTPTPLSSTSAGGAGVSLTIANVAPVAGTHNLTTTMGQALSVSAATLAGLGYDANHDALSITGIAAGATNGTASLSGGTLTYTPNSGYAGADTFTYTVSDGAGSTSTGTAKITVRLGSATSTFTSISSPVNNTVNLRGYGLPGNNYDVQESSDSSFATYTTLATVTAAANAVIFYSDTSATNSPRYYRFAAH